jgi:hypothetical protein
MTPSNKSALKSLSQHLSDHDFSVIPERLFERKVSYERSGRRRCLGHPTNSSVFVASGGPARMGDAVVLD